MKMKIFFTTIIIFLLIFLYRGIRWSVIPKTAYILITRFMQKRITKAEEELQLLVVCGKCLADLKGQSLGSVYEPMTSITHILAPLLSLLPTRWSAAASPVNNHCCFFIVAADDACKFTDCMNPGLQPQFPGFDWHPTQQASTETPVVKTALFAFSDLHLYLNVKPPGSSKVSWHLNSFSWPARPWDWSDLSAEAFKRMPSRTAEQRKPTTDQGLCIYLDL